MKSQNQFHVFTHGTGIVAPTSITLFFLKIPKAPEMMIRPLTMEKATRPAKKDLRYSMT